MRVLSAPHRRGRPAAALLAGPLFLLAASGCGLTTDLGRPENARIDLTGPASSEMEMVVSTEFLVVDGAVSFVSADTSTVSPPLNRTFDLGIPARLYFKASNAGDQVETFTLRVWIGDERWCNETKTLEPGEPFEFVYRYNEPGIS